MVMGVAKPKFWEGQKFEKYQNFQQSPKTRLKVVLFWPNLAKLHVLTPQNRGVGRSPRRW